MEIINEPIRVIAIFEKGKVQPVKFYYNDNYVKIEKILKISENKKLNKLQMITKLGSPIEVR